MVPLKKILFGLRSAYFWGKRWEAEMSHSACQNLYWQKQIEFVLISKNLRIASNICYEWTNVKSSGSIFVLRGWFWVKSFDLWLKNSIFVVEGMLCVCSLHRDLQIFLLTKRDGLDLGCWSSRCTVHLCACSLHAGSLNVFLIFEREGLDLWVLSLRERNFDLKQSPSLNWGWSSFFHLGSDSIILRNDLFLLGKNPVNEGVGFYL